MSWVFDESESTGGARLVLLAIANHHNRDTGACFPGYDTLAAEARLSRSATIAAVKRLEADGMLLVRRGGGRGQSNNYRIPGFDKGCGDATVSPEPRAPKGPEKGRVETDERVAFDPLNSRAHATRTNEPTRRTKEPRAARAETPSPSLFEEGSPEAQRASASPFDEWWATYPRKIDKKPARVVYDARLREGVEPGQLLLAAKHYAQTREGEPSKFTKHPKTFLAKDGPWTEWVNGPPEGEVPPAIYDGELEWDARTLSWRVAE